MSFRSLLKIAWFAAISSVSLMAGVEHGSGGNVVWHSENGKPIFQLLDYYQGQRIYGITEDLGQGNTEWDLALNVLNRYETIDPDRAKIFLNSLHSFQDDWRPQEHTNLDPVDDYGKIQLENGYKVKQVILQFQPTEEEEGRYLVDKDTWDLLDTHTRAGLILHEIIYREGIRRGQVNSIHARYLNILISSTRLQGMPKDKYFAKIHSSAYDAYSFNPGGTEYRYFPWKIGTREEVSKFCLGLGPDGNLLGGNYFQGVWNQVAAGAIGEAVRELPDNQVEAKTVWIKRDVFVQYNLVVLGQNLQFTDSGSKGAAFCQFTPSPNLE